MVMALPVPRFTIDMLDDFPADGIRYELLEGLLIVTPAPSFNHQLVATRLATMLSLALGDAADVVAIGAIQQGDNTQLQPDILVLPGGDHPDDWREIHGWWLAVEVMSPSSRVYDREVKRAAYLALGVQEYWLVDRRARSIEVWKPDLPSGEIVTDVIAWKPASLRRTISIDPSKAFEGISH